MSEVDRIKERVSYADTSFKDGKTVVEVGLTDINRLLEIGYLAQQAYKIMSFHASRCPLNIPDNFSGSEEHLAEYRSVMTELEQKL